MSSIRFGWIFLVITAVLLQTSANPLPVSLNELLSEKIQAGRLRDVSVHGHIAAVNDAYRAAREHVTRAQVSEALEEVIERTNEAAQRDLFEGDIELDAGETEDSVRRNVIAGSSKRWGRKVSYHIPANMGYAKALIKDAIRELRKRTCVRFKEVPASYKGDFIKFDNKGGCSSYLGRRGGAQTLLIGRGCEHKGVVMHELMHALGIYHEQSRPDRDNYVQILWNNIKPGKENNFKTYTHGKLDMLNLPYDTSSIMHYDRFLFSKDGRSPTIIARGRPWTKLGGQASGTLTENDVLEINSLFGC
ncbi:meprin A subunit beta isoform X2 [Nematostella vectensis]|nr:meprin A subunit beta isoform X2 [Nematostella vectensis]